jgi:hypothetical protein
MKRISRKPARNCTYVVEEQLGAMVPVLFMHHDVADLGV